MASSGYGYGAKAAFCTAANEVIPGPHAASTFGGTNFCFDAVGNQTRSSSGRVLEYTAFDLPSKMTHTASNQRSDFDYGPNRERIRRIDYTGVTTPVWNRTTHFVGNAEIARFDTGKVEIRRYVSGTIRVRTKESGRVWERIDYLFTDNQGSTHVISDMDAAVLNTMSFDAFGKRRDESTWLNHAVSTQLSYNSSAKTQHGYTGHEQVDGIGLIHMNGRLYDPVVMRFVQADPMVQAPTDAQSWNRYAYVFNNPLAHTDPTGYWGQREQGALRTVAAIIISVYTGGAASAAATSTQAFWITVAGGAAAGGVQSGTARGALTGAFSAGLFFGIGSAAGQVGGADSWNWAQRAAAHGAAGGIMAELQGGNFGNGFASAAFSSAAGSAIGDSIKNTTAEGIVHAVIGGTASELSGGKFANGAVTAAFSYAFNWVAHSGEVGEEYHRLYKTRAGSTVTAEAPIFADGFESLQGTPWMDVALGELGVSELAGSANNNQSILNYHATSGGFTTDEVPWCSSFVNWAMSGAGVKGTASPSALSWRNWGQRLSQAAYGSIAVIDWGRGKGHVGFVAGMNASGQIVLLGGNQSDSVRYSAFSASLIDRFVYPSAYAPSYALPGVNVIGASSLQSTR